MNRVLWMCVLVSLFAVGTGCKKKMMAIPSDTSASGEVAKAGSALAYEHTIEIELPRSALAQRAEAVRDACNDARFGACSVLALEQNGGSRARASIIVRVVPAGVEPLVAIAAKDGTIESRQTRAEDLADAVADTATQVEMLTLQRSTLMEFRARKDLAVTDMIALSGELATVDSRLQSAQQTSATQQRRIETNLLTIRFSVPYEPESRTSRVGDSFVGLLDGLTEGVEEALEMLGYGIPFLLLAFPLALAWRWLWRCFTRARAV